MGRQAFSFLFYTSNVKIPANAVNKNALIAQDAICHACSQQSDIGATPCHARGNNARRVKTMNMFRAVFTLVIFVFLYIIAFNVVDSRFEQTLGFCARSDIFANNVSSVSGSVTS